MSADQVVEVRRSRHVMPIVVCPLLVTGLLALRVDAHGIGDVPGLIVEKRRRSRPVPDLDRPVLVPLVVGVHR